MKTNINKRVQDIFYWFCWVVIGVIVVYIVLKVGGGIS